jgi:hypothetical protein
MLKPSDLPLQQLDRLVLDRVLVPQASGVDLACRIGRAAHRLLLLVNAYRGNLRKAAPVTKL